MDPEIRVELRFRSKQTFLDELTHQLGILPTRVFKTGDLIPKTKLKVAENIWCLSAEINEKTDKLSDFIEPIVENLYEKKEHIEKFCEEKEIYCEIACTIYIVSELPTIFIKPMLMNKMAEMNVNLNIDIILSE